MYNLLTKNFEHKLKSEVFRVGSFSISVWMILAFIFLIIIVVLAILLIKNIKKIRLMQSLTEIEDDNSPSTDQNITLISKDEIFYEDQD